MQTYPKTDDYIKNATASLVIMLTALLCFTPSLLASEIEISVPDGMAQMGSEVTFTITASNKDKLMDSGTAKVALSENGEKVVLEKEFDLSKENPVKITGTCSTIGFLTCTADLPELKRPLVQNVAISPEKLKPSRKAPDDFMEFWKNAIAELEKIEPDFKLNKLDKYSTDAYTCYELNFANIKSTRGYAYLTVPNKEGTFPALVQGSGSFTGLTTPPVDYVEDGAIHFYTSPHHMSIYPRDGKTTREIMKEGGYNPGYLFTYKNGRDNFDFKRIILSAHRAIGWLEKYEIWNKKQMVIHGSSQPGGMSLIMAALNQNITAIHANVPALCDLTGKTVARRAGWPVIFRDLDDAQLTTVSYYDVVNFVPYIKCPVVVGVGFQDTTCVPGSVYVAYNQITSPKQIVHGVRSAHGYSPEIRAMKKPWILKQLGLNP